MNQEDSDYFIKNRKTMCKFFLGLRSPKIKLFFLLASFLGTAIWKKSWSILFWIDTINMIHTHTHTYMQEYTHIVNEIMAHAVWHRKSMNGKITLEKDTCIFSYFVIMIVCLTVFACIICIIFCIFCLGLKIVFFNFLAMSKHQKIICSCVELLCVFVKFCHFLYKNKPFSSS